MKNTPVLATCYAFSKSFKNAGSLESFWKLWLSPGMCMRDPPVAKIASQAEEIPRQCLSLLIQFQLQPQAQFCLRLL